jgi:hypothetical protein
MTSVLTHIAALLTYSQIEIAKARILPAPYVFLCLSVCLSETRERLNRFMTFYAEYLNYSIKVSVKIEKK